MHFSQYSSVRHLLGKPLDSNCGTKSFGPPWRNSRHQVSQQVGGRPVGEDSEIDLCQLARLIQRSEGKPGSRRMTHHLLCGQTGASLLTAASLKVLVQGGASQSAWRSIPGCTCFSCRPLYSHLIVPGVLVHLWGASCLLPLWSVAQSPALPFALTPPFSCVQTFK